MNKEEAIMELNRFSGTTQLKLSANFWTALNMAIKSLEQQPSEDCVSRQNVINYIRTLSCDLSYWSVTDEVVKDIEKLPPVTPTTCIAKVTFDKDDLQELVDEKVKELAQHMGSRWIPVSERLPQLKEQVLFCEKDKVFVGHMVFEYNGSSVFSTPYCNYYYVTAWMPLPEPYKPETESEE